MLRAPGLDGLEFAVFATNRKRRVEYLEKENLNSFRDGGEKNLNCIIFKADSMTKKLLFLAGYSHKKERSLSPHGGGGFDTLIFEH